MITPTPPRPHAHTLVSYPPPGLLPRSLFATRNAPRLPCGDVCLDPDYASCRRSARPPASEKSSAAGAGGVATEVAGAGEKPPRGNVRGHDDGKDGAAIGGNSSNDSSGSEDGRGSGRKGRPSRKDKGSHGGSSGAGEGCRDGGELESSGGGESESRGRRDRSESEAGHSDQGSDAGDPRRRRRHRDDGRRDRGSSLSGSEEEDGRASSEGPALSPRNPPARHDETPRKRTRTSEGRGAASSDDGGGTKSGEGASVEGRGRPGGQKAVVEYFPVNAGALCAAVEKVPENALCGHRYLAPLVDLVSSGEAA